MLLMRVVSMAPVVKVQVVQMVQWDLPKAALAKAMAPDSLQAASAVALDRVLSLTDGWHPGRSSYIYGDDGSWQ